jgi:hypothetical protein
MHARIVRFSGASREAIDGIKQRIEQEDGPPEGVDSTGMKLFFDESQGTAIFVGFFEDEEKLRVANEIFDAMDPGDTPGTRESVDQCEVVIERDA